MINQQLYKERGRYIKLVPILHQFNSVHYIVIDVLEGRLMYYPQKTVDPFLFYSGRKTWIRRMYQLRFRNKNQQIRFLIPPISHKNQLAEEYVVVGRLTPCSLSKDELFQTHYRFEELAENDLLKIEEERKAEVVITPRGKLPDKMET